MEKESHKPTGAGVTSLPDSSHKEKKGPHKTGPRVNQCMLELPVKRYNNDNNLSKVTVSSIIYNSSCGATCDGVPS